MPDPSTTAANVAAAVPTPVDDRLISRLRKILALTASPEEGEAATAATMLQRFLIEHNLTVADLEAKGSQKVVAITEQGIDLGKAAFRWKMDLADEIAEHYLCVGIVNRITKTVTFAGRPDNVESLKLLYTWVVDQIRRLATEERKRHQVENGEHIDPLRWQVNFGMGAVGRLMTRLNDKKEDADADTTALVLHHSKEISDYTEKKYGRRYDGQETQRDKERSAYWDAYYKKRAEEERIQREADEQLLATDPQAYYRQYPNRHPDVVAEAERRETRNAARRARYQPRGRYSYRSCDYDKEGQSDVARRAGKSAADRINLDPFLTGKTPADTKPLKSGKGGR